MYSQPDSRTELSPPTVQDLVQQYKDRLARHTSRLFAVLMLLQWIGAIVTAIVVSPYTWRGTTNSIHIHVWAAVFLGGVISVVPISLALAYPARALTRHVIAAGQ